MFNGVQSITVKALRPVLFLLFFRRGFAFDRARHRGPGGFQHAVGVQGGACVGLCIPGPRAGNGDTTLFHTVPSSARQARNEEKIHAVLLGRRLLELILFCSIRISQEAEEDLAEILMSVCTPIFGGWPPFFSPQIPTKSPDQRTVPVRTIFCLKGASGFQGVLL